MAGPYHLPAAFNGSVDEAIRVFNRAFERGEEIYQATLGGEVAHFEYGAGEEISFYARLSPHRDEDRSLTATREFGEGQSVKIASVGFNRVDLMSELLPESQTADPLRFFTTETPDAINYAIRLPLRRIVSKLHSNGTCLFDGLSFFNDSHKCNPISRGSTDTFDNDLVASVTESGWAGLKDAIMQVKGTQGYLPNVNMGRPVIWVPTDVMAVKFAKLFTGGAFYAKEPTAATTAASESIIVTSTADIVTVPELFNTTADADAAKHYYVWLRSSTRQRGMIVRMPQMPRMRRDDVTFRSTNNAIAVYADMEYGDSYGDPRKCFRVSES